VPKASLQLIDDALGENRWLAGDEASIADLAIYPYLALSPEGRVDLAPFKNILRWFGDIRRLDGYVGMPGMHE
jgi:glutathione S-transferase